MNFLSVYVPAQPVLTLDTFPRFTISGGKINLTASSITLTPISPGAGITSPLGT